MLKKALLLSCSLLLAACASYGGSGLMPGQARLEDVQQTMGQPALRWQDPDGSMQLAYPRGPVGFDTFMVRLGPDGTLKSIENVLDERHLATVRVGMSKEQVLRVLGPPDAGATAYFKARDELVWDWRFYAPGTYEPMRMMVLFDATAGTVRSTMVKVEYFGYAENL
ncbi:MAG: outer membrane protein assembly factor BamE [Sulfuritalea sp.]|nr:outer membrane protein assembly factor BamE [Sulfuritalea sp.]MDP1983587.1 outer membrane protein assembly factor BamE [Sulfuritalea sp.]